MHACVCVCVWSHPTVVCRCVLVLVGGRQSRYQRLHVYDEVFMAQRVETSTLTKLSSARTTTEVKRLNTAVRFTSDQVVGQTVRTCTPLEAPSGSWSLPLSLPSPPFH